MIAAFRAGIGARIPLGYQDETGFHYGMAPISSILERLDVQVLGVEFVGG